MGEPPTAAPIVAAVVGVGGRVARAASAGVQGAINATKSAFQQRIEEQAAAAAAAKAAADAKAAEVAAVAADAASRERLQDAKACVAEGELLEAQLGELEAKHNFTKPSGVQGGNWDYHPVRVSAMRNEERLNFKVWVEGYNEWVAKARGMAGSWPVGDKARKAIDQALLKDGRSTNLGKRLHWGLLRISTAQLSRG